MAKKKREEALILTYKPNTGNQEEAKELPARILVMMDTGERDDKAVKDRLLYQNITKDSFNEKLRAMNIRVDFKVDDVLSGKGKLHVKGKIEDVHDFDPDALAEPQKYSIRTLGSDGNSGDEQGGNELDKALMLQSALEQLEANLDEGDQETFFKMVSDISNDIASSAEVRDEAIRELKAGDITGILGELNFSNKT